MEISDEMLERVNEEPRTVGLEVCRMIGRKVNVTNANSNEAILLEAVLFLAAAQANELIGYSAQKPSIVNGALSALEAFNFITRVQKELESDEALNKAIEHQQQLEARFNRGITKSFGYEFTDGDFKRLQLLVNQLRELIPECVELDDAHKRRLLKRLERLQGELHKKVSDLDQLYCMAIETSVVARKIGENAKPLVAIAKELMGISWRTQAHGESLPSGTEPPKLNAAPDEPDDTRES